MNGVTIKAVDGGFLVEWQELVEIDWSKIAVNAPAESPGMGHDGGGMAYPRYRRAQRQAVREHMDEAMALVQTLLKKKAKQVAESGVGEAFLAE